MAYASMAETDEMLDREAHAFRIIRQNTGQARGVVCAVDQNRRRAGAQALRDGRIVSRDGRKDQTVHALCDELVDHLSLPRAIPANVGDDGGVTALAENFSNSAENGRETGVGDVRRENADEARAPGSQPGGDRIAPVAEFFCDRPDATGHVLGDEMRGIRAERRETVDT